MQNVEVLFYALGGTAAIAVFVAHLVSLASCFWLRDTPVPRPFNGVLPFAATLGVLVIGMTVAQNRPMLLAFLALAMVMLAFAVKGFSGAHREAPSSGPPRFHGLE